MPVSFLFILGALFFGSAVEEGASFPVAPLPPAAGTVLTEAVPISALELPPAPDPQDKFPVRLIIPKIRLNAPVVNVGLNAKGEMDVPDGATKNVGWYQDGTVPGDRGSAVLDAHVYAAFKDLRYAKVGDDVFVTAADGQIRRFVIKESLVYPVAGTPAELLFNRADAKRLNLITCAGKFSKKLGTYTHRLIVYATLAE